MPIARSLLDYDAEAEAYDATQGGVPRAEARRRPSSTSSRPPRADPTYRLVAFVRD